jgi:hypothetical protein
MSAEDDKKATEVVKAILNDKAVDQIDFKMGAVSISAGMYEDVIDAIDNSQITIIVEPKALKPDEAGRYFQTWTIDKDNEWYNIIVLRSAALDGSANEQFHVAAAIVHECTHAGLDLRKIPDMAHFQHEAAAYVAEAVFEISKMLLLKGDPSKVNVTQPIQKAAWDIAMLITSKKEVPKDLWNTLNVKISVSDEYKKAAKEPLKNLGVGRKWKIKQAVTR